MDMGHVPTTTILCIWWHGTDWTQYFYFSILFDGIERRIDDDHELDTAIFFFYARDELRFFPFTTTITTTLSRFYDNALLVLFLVLRCSSSVIPRIWT
jgi:hypothetical protein